MSIKGISLREQKLMREKAGLVRQLDELINRIDRAGEENLKKLEAKIKRLELSLLGMTLQRDTVLKELNELKVCYQIQQETIEILGHGVALEEIQGEHARALKVRD